MSAPSINWDFRVPRWCTDSSSTGSRALNLGHSNIWSSPLSNRVHESKAESSSVLSSGSVLGEGAALQSSTPQPYSWSYTQPTQPPSSSELYGFNWSTRGSSQTPASSVTSAGMPKGYLLASLWGSPVGLSSSNKQVINWLPLQNRVWIHCLRTKASGVNLSKRWAMDSYPGSSTVNLLLPLQLFIIIEAFSKRGILPISHYHNLNNLQYNLFHDRIWAGLPLPQAFRYTNKLLTAHLHFNSIYSLYTNSNLYQVI